MLVATLFTLHAQSAKLLHNKCEIVAHMPRPLPSQAASKKKKKKTSQKQPKIHTKYLASVAIKTTEGAQEPSCYRSRIGITSPEWANESNWAALGTDRNRAFRCHALSIHRVCASPCELHEVVGIVLCLLISGPDSEFQSQS